MVAGSVLASPLARNSRQELCEVRRNHGNSFFSAYYSLRFHLSDLSRSQNFLSDNYTAILIRCDEESSKAAVKPFKKKFEVMTTAGQRRCDFRL